MTARAVLASDPRYRTYTSLAAAQAAAAAVDAACGYPNAATRTLRYAVVIARPDGASWAYLDDPTTRRVLPAAVTAQLDGTWVPTGEAPL